MTITRDPFTWAVLVRDGIGLAIAAGAGIALWLRKRSARYWPMTYGRVEQASYFENNGVWLTDIAYSYKVANEFYSGQFQIRDRSEHKASANVDRWKDQNIAVRYSPQEPHISVVRIEDQASLHPADFRGH
jgi:uncharacterized protein YkuJ